MTLSQYVICFILYSFFGWLYESLFYSVQFKKPVNTGFLRGCFCPIYGVACVGNIILLDGVQSNLSMFVISMVVISFIEYIVSYVLENLFDKRWWDYSDWPGNIHGRISVISSLGFGVLSVAQMRILHPIVMLFVSKLPPRAEVGLIAVCGLIFALDLLMTMRDMDNEENKDKLWFVSEEPVMIQKTNEKLAEKKRNISEHYTNVREKIRDMRNR